MNVSPNIFAKNKKIQKTETRFWRWKSTDNNGINIVLSLENAFLTLIMSYCKIVQKNKLCYPKQHKIGYLMIYDVIYSLFVLNKKLAFFNKQL